MNALKNNAAPFHARAPPAKPVQQPRVSSIPVPEAAAPTGNPEPEKMNGNSGVASFLCLELHVKGVYCKSHLGDNTF